MKKRYYMLDLLRVLAILLVFNSHCDALYPIPALATGGAAGNVIFFALSGYLLSIRTSFGPYFAKRLVRLYPGAMIAATAGVLLGSTRLASPGDFVQAYLWPTAFWFVGAIVLFTALIYPLDRLGYARHFGLFTAVMVAIYLAAYLLVVDTTRWSVEEAGLASWLQCFKLIYYFYVYALGHAMKLSPPKQGRWGSGPWTALAAALFLLSIGVKAMFVKWPGLLKVQFLAQWFSVGFCYCAMRAALAWKGGVPRGAWASFLGVMGRFANLSLEMYLVQLYVIERCVRWRFPINVALAFALTLLLAFALQVVDRWIAGGAEGLWRNGKEGVST